MSIPETALVPPDHRKLLEEHLDKALRKIIGAIDSTNDKIALAAAKWVAEMVLGKPNQAIQVNDSGKELAVALVQALREAMAQSRSIPPPARIIEGSVRVLGVPETITPGSDTSPAQQVPLEVVGTDDDFPS